MDEIGADEMVKSPKVDLPPGVYDESVEEPGQSSKGPDPMQEPQKDAWLKAKTDEANQPPAWVVEMILQQNAAMITLHIYCKRPAARLCER